MRWIILLILVIIIIGSVTNYLIFMCFKYTYRVNLIPQEENRVLQMTKNKQISSQTVSSCFVELIIFGHKTKINAFQFI